MGTHQFWCTFYSLDGAGRQIDVLKSKAMDGTPFCLLKHPLMHKPFMKVIQTNKNVQGPGWSFCHVFEVADLHKIMQNHCLSLLDFCSHFLKTFVLKIAFERCQKKNS